MDEEKGNGWRVRGEYVMQAKRAVRANLEMDALSDLQALEKLRL